MYLRSNNLKLLSIIFCSIFAFASNLIAQENQQCNRRNSVTVSEALKNAQKTCCNKSKKKNCLKRLRNKRLNGAKKKLPDAFVNLLKLELKQSITSSCADVTANSVCTDEAALTLNETEAEISNRCCGLAKNKKRKDCLDKSMKQMRNLRTLFGNKFYKSMQKKINSLKSAESCGAGGEKPNGTCEQIRAHVDGANNYLHKPVSDSTGSIVNLFPPSEYPRDCKYENQSGDSISGAYGYHRTNPNRITVRPSKGGSCRTFPSPTVLNCSISGVRVCRIMPNPCQRYD